MKLSWPKIVIQCAGMNRHAAYGKDFDELQRHCEGKSCLCVADFKVISSTENAKEFADYVTSLEHGRVPVVYDLVLSEEGRFVGARLLRVGDWTSDRSHHDDGLLGVQVTFKAGAAQVERCLSPSPAPLTASPLGNINGVRLNDG